MRKLHKSGIWSDLTEKNVLVVQLGVQGGLRLLRGLWALGLGFVGERALSVKGCNVRDM